MIVSPSLTQLDLSGTSEFPNSCLKEGELEPRQSFCPDFDQGTSGSSNVTHPGRLWGGDRLLRRIRPFLGTASELLRGISLPLGVFWGLCLPCQTGGLLRIEIALPKDFHSSFLQMPWKIPSLGKSCHTGNLSPGWQRGRISEGNSRPDQPDSEQVLPRSLPDLPLLSPSQEPS